MRLDLLDMRANFLALARPSVALCRSADLDWRVIEATCGGVFLAPIRAEGTFFGFDPEGFEAAAVEVRAADSRTVLDLVTWAPAVPDLWFRAVGGAPALGIAHATNRATYAAGLPLQVLRSPAEWLQERCHGVVLLNLDAGVEWLTGVELATTIAVHDDAHARQIDRARRRMGLSRHQRLVVRASELREVA